ncbi:MAG: hypothetical protein IBX55_09940 [Methyloprofundus sp.]|nr:hypothetical protein [Methyloprofundus sp.]
MSIFKDIQKIASLKVQLHSSAEPNVDYSIMIMRIVKKYRRVPFIGRIVRDIAHAQ